MEEDGGRRTANGGEGVGGLPVLSRGGEGKGWKTGASREQGKVFVARRLRLVWAPTGRRGYFNFSRKATGSGRIASRLRNVPGVRRAGSRARASVMWDQRSGTQVRGRRPVIHRLVGEGVEE